MDISSGSAISGGQAGPLRRRRRCPERGQGGDPDLRMDDVTGGRLGGDRMVAAIQIVICIVVQKPPLKAAPKIGTIIFLNIKVYEHIYIFR